MKIIYKYPLDFGLAEVIRIAMPKGAIILDCQYDAYRSLQLWAEVDDDNPGTEQRQFEIFGTGESIPDNSKYICTIQDWGFTGNFVWHIYELEII